MGQEGPKSRLPAQACGPLARPRPPLRAGRAFQQFLPARPPGLCPDGAQPAHPRGHGFGLRRPWPRALRMPEGFRGSRPCLGSPFQGPVPVPTAWPHPLNHFCTRRQAFLPTLHRRSEGAGEGGEPSSPPQLQLAPPGAFPPSLAPAPSPSLCLIVPPPGAPSSTALRLTCCRKAAQQAANQASGWGVWSPLPPNTLRPTPQPWQGTHIDLTVIRHLLCARPNPTGLTSSSQPQDPGRGSGHPGELTQPCPAPAPPPAGVGCCADGE